MEAEYGGLVTGAQEGLLIKNLAFQLGWPLNVVIECDSISTQASAQRRGVLHVKHMAIRLLFVKELVEQGLLRIERVASGDNLADWLTKPFGEKPFAANLARMKGICLKDEKEMENFENSETNMMEIAQAEEEYDPSSAWPRVTSSSLRREKLIACNARRCTSRAWNVSSCAV